jgi:hypothetical protein
MAKAKRLHSTPRVDSSSGNIIKLPYSVTREPTADAHGG